MIKGFTTGVRGGKQEKLDGSKNPLPTLLYRGYKIKESFDSKERKFYLPQDVLFINKERKSTLSSAKAKEHGM